MENIKREIIKKSPSGRGGANNETDYHALTYILQSIRSVTDLTSLAVRHHMNTQQHFKALPHLLVDPLEVLENLLHHAATLRLVLGLDEVYLSLREDWGEAGVLPGPARRRELGGGVP